VNREIVGKIYDTSVAQAVDEAKDGDEQFSSAWIWEENMVKYTIQEVRHILSLNGVGLSNEQKMVLSREFGLSD
jgi:hypothetical protein